MFFYNYYVDALSGYDVDSVSVSKDFEDLNAAKKYARGLVKVGFPKELITIYGNARFNF